MFEKLRLSLLDFLNEGNHLFVITTSRQGGPSHSHDRLDFTINEIINRFYSKFFNYKDKISFFMVADANELSRLNKTHNFELYEKCKVYFTTGLKITFIESKDKIFDHIGKEYDLENFDIYTIGDDWAIDINMLLKGMTLGGKSSFIRSDFYNEHNESIDQILWATVMREYETTMPTKRNERSLERDYSIFNAFAYQRLKELYSKVEKGEINIHELLTKNMLYELMETGTPLTSLHTGYKKIDFERVKSIDIYPTFEDYSARVLMKK